MDYSQYPRNNILCVDFCSFYASVECVERGLDPMTTMLAVVGDMSRQGSIVLASSPELKRRYGLSNVNRYYDIPLDPRIIVVPARMGLYVEKSLEVTKYLNNFVPPEAIHVYSIDESWITTNGTEKLFGDRWQIAKKIKQGLMDEFGLPCSIGIGDNKFLAKVVMDIYGKKQGIAECRYEDVERLLWPIKVGKIWGIGSKLEKRLYMMAIRNLGQIAKRSIKSLKSEFGVMGEQLYWHAWGIDLSPVIGDFTKQENKAFGNGITLLRDYNGKEVKTVILELCEEVCYRTRASKKAGRTIQLSIGYTKELTGGFSRSMSIETPTNITKEVYKVCMQLFDKFYKEGSLIRRVNVSLSNLCDETDLQLDLFHDRTKDNDIGKAMDEIRNRFGKTAIVRASSYTDAGITLDRSKKIGGHFA